MTIQEFQKQAAKFTGVTTKYTFEHGVHKVKVIYSNAITYNFGARDKYEFENELNIILRDKMQVPEVNLS